MQGSSIKFPWLTECCHISSFCEPLLPKNEMSLHQFLPNGHSIFVCGWSHHCELRAVQQHHPQQLGQMKPHLHSMAKLYRCFVYPITANVFSPLKSWPVSLDSSCKGFILWPRFTFRVDKDLGWAFPKSHDFLKTKLICSQIPVDPCTNFRQFSFFFDKLFWLYVSILSPEAHFVKLLSQTTTADVRGMEAILPARHV